MFQYHFQQWLIVFFIYCFIGWVFESTLVSVVQRKLINRGFLHGPALPIYGSGAIVILFSTLPYRDSIPLTFTLGMFAATLLELVTGEAMEAMFKVRYWDYSDARFNFRGHISLKSSLCWGALSVLMVAKVHKPIEAFVFSMGDRLTTDLAFGLSMLFLADTYYSAKKAFSLRRFLEESEQLRERAAQIKRRVDDLRDDLNEQSEDVRQAVVTAKRRASQLTQEARRNLEAIRKRAEGMLPAEVYAELDARLTENQRQIESWRDRARVEYAAFAADHPYVTSRYHKEALKALAEQVREEIDEREIEEEEESRQRFARGRNLSKIFWIFLIASVLGCVAETLFCLVTRGHYENRVGAVFGPISPVYGIGAVALTLGLYDVRFKRVPIVFISGAIVGGAVEYLCSFVQEWVFGSVSWDYSELPLNINGRICLLYCIFWGFLAILWIKLFFPAMNRFILRSIPEKAGPAITLILCLLLILDEGLTCAAVIRWNRRTRGQPAITRLEHKLDEWFTDAYMEDLFINMQFTEQAPQVTAGKE